MNYTHTTRLFLCLLFFLSTNTVQAQIADSIAVGAHVGDPGELSHGRHGAPSYQTLRFEEDYSYLAKSSERQRFSDRYKYIALGSNVWLEMGGEVRFRYEEETNKFLIPDPQFTDSFLLARLALHADLQIKGVGRIFVEGIHGEVFGRDELLFFIHRNRLDLHQLFFDLSLINFTLRIGRQEMAKGRERMISASGWGRMRKRFDAITLISQIQNWEVSAWFSRPVTSETISSDYQDKDIDFAGIYLSGLSNTLDIYYLYQHNRDMRLNPNGNMGSEEVHTIGARFEKKKGPFDVDLESAIQPFGQWAGDDVRAWSVGASAGYSFLSSMRRPRIGVGVEIASGDKDPMDGKVNTFNQLYRQEKDHLGYLVMYGRQNIRALNVNARVGLIPRKVLLEVFHYWFALDSDNDALYNPGAFPLPGRRDFAGESGTNVGREIDLVLGWQVDRHHSLLIGYMHYSHGAFIQSTGDVKTPGNVFMQYKLLF